MHYSTAAVLVRVPEDDPVAARTAANDAADRFRDLLEAARPQSLTQLPSADPTGARVVWDDHYSDRTLRAEMPVDIDRLSFRSYVNYQCNIIRAAVEDFLKLL